MKIGYALCGSFCTHSAALREMQHLVEMGHEIIPILSETASSTDTRFGTADALRSNIIAITNAKIIRTIADAEPLGPKRPMDALIISPCTGNTLAKLAAGITDTAVCMAAKAHMRTSRPVLIALATNDAMSANLSSIAHMLQKKNIYFVPLFQDDPVNKPHSLVADFSLIPEAFEAMLAGSQMRPLFRNMT